MVLSGLLFQSVADYFGELKLVLDNKYSHNIADFKYIPYLLNEY